MTHAPIVEEFQLRCDAERAFATFARIGGWWDPHYTRDAATLAGVTIEPRVGGRVYASFRDGADDDWGRVLVWDPPRRLVYTTTLAQQGPASEIAVTFAPREGGGCTMRFEHGGWNESNAADRAKFRDWRKLLDRFAALAEA